MPCNDDRDAELARHREAIDSLDREILEKLNARASHAHAIGALKAGGPAYRPEREAQILSRLAIENSGPLANDAVTLDFHANVSQAMVENSTALVIYKTNPHVDQRRNTFARQQLFALLVQLPRPLRTAHERGSAARPQIGDPLVIDRSVAAILFARGVGHVRPLPSRRRAVL